MISLDPVLTLSILLVIALAGGMIAHRLRQPILLGYLLIGILAGPHALGWIQDTQMIEAAASFGVALLMFTVGMEISLNQLVDVGKVGMWGGLSQIIATLVLGTVAGLWLFNWTLGQSIIFGMIISLSSTAICLKLLMERGELSSLHGRIMIAFLILQDISVVIMMVVLPLMGTSGGNFFMDLGLAIGKSVLFIGAAIVLGRWVLPWLLGDVGGVRSRELFLLTVLVLCLGATVGTYLLGLSMVFGAFLIGLILRSTRFVHQALAEITPLRDIFATLFFVSIGMLLDPRLFIDNWQTILAILGIIIVIKILSIFALVRAFGYNNRIALFTGAGLFQVGEFGFVLAQGAMDQGIFTGQMYSLILSAIVISMILTPFIISAVSRLYTTAIEHLPGTKLQAANTCLKANGTGPGKIGHVVIAGYGRVGRNVAAGLDHAGIPYRIIDIDPECLSKAAACAPPHIYGDASNLHVLMQADLCNASAMVITYPYHMAVVAAVKNALIINPDIKLLARYNYGQEAQTLEKLGVAELINPEYEASFRFYKQLLKITGFAKDHRMQILDAIRNGNNQPR